MPPNTSATGGYIQPAVAPAPLEDKALEDFLQEVFVGISGLTTDKIRPNWQPEPPNQPDFGTDWIAFGITRQAADAYAAVIHDVNGLGTDELQRHETVEVIISSYGDNATKNLAVLRDGLQVEQNRAVLESVAIGMIETGEILAMPALVKNRWTRRFQMMFTFRRQIRRSYPVLTILTAQVELDTEAMQETINITP